MNHPYAEFEHTPARVVLEKAIRELEENHDLKLTTLNEYLVGYMLQAARGERAFKPHIFNK